MFDLVEAPPDYHFTKLLPKSHTGPVSEELILQCSLNSYRATVRWFKEKTEIKEGDERFSIDKDIIGTQGKDDKDTIVKCPSSPPLQRCDGVLMIATPPSHCVCGKVLT